MNLKRKIPLIACYVIPKNTMLYQEINLGEKIPHNKI